jgi:hypothetical protein
MRDSQGSDRGIMDSGQVRGVDSRQERIRFEGIRDARRVQSRRNQTKSRYKSSKRYSEAQDPDG